MILHFSQIFLTDGFTFIVFTMPFYSYMISLRAGVFTRKGLLRSPCDPSLGKVVDAYLDCYLVAWENLDIVHSELA